MNLSLSTSPPLGTHLGTQADAVRRRAVTAIVSALAFGTLTQALFWRTGLGVNFFVWNLAVLGGHVALFAPSSTRGRRVAPTAAGAIACSLLLSFSVVLYASDWTVSIAVPADLAILAGLPFLLRDAPTVAGVSAVPATVLRSLGRTRHAATLAARLPREAVGNGARTLLGASKGLLLGAPAAAFFALLLSADDDFRRVLDAVRERCGEGVLFVTWSVATAAMHLVAVRLPAPIVVTPRADGFADGPFRGGNDAALAGPYLGPRTAPPRVTPVVWSMVVGQVAVVFAVFVLANLRHLFGGSAVVREADGPTYASYLHAGFAQLLVATALSVWLVVSGHRLLRARDERGRPVLLGPVPGGRVLAALEASLLALAGATVASCAQRLAIYVDAYGATRERLGVALVMLALLGVLVLSFAKVMARSWNGHGGAALAFLAGLAVFASAINADDFVAETNLDRAARGAELDAGYLASLSPDARGVLSHPVVQGRPGLAWLLRQRYCPGNSGDWRARRGIGQCTAPAPPEPTDGGVAAAR
jgi:hypothetical protein